MKIHRITASAVTIVAVIAAACTSHAAQPTTITNSIDMKLTLIPAGTFTMGSSLDEQERDDKEKPHKVTLTKPFYMSVFEVTQTQYKAGAPGSSPKFVFRGDDNPVENVEWTEAKRFCELLSNRPEERKAGRTYRLPTEAEWEYACRAGASTVFHYGDSLSSTQANFNGNYPAGGGERGKYVRRTTKVGSYEPNAFGLYDMHGNVAEWCADWYDPEYYFDSPAEDPLGPSQGIVPTKFNNNGNENFFVVVRGGCWVDDGRACRSAYRFRAMPKTQYRLIGFRVVCEVEEE